MNTFFYISGYCLFSDMTFWTVIISGIAVILSQLPPISRLLKKAKIELDIYPKININHKVGNPNVSAYVKLTNIGGGEVKVNKFLVKIYKDNSQITELKCQTFGEFNTENEKAFLFTPFRLKIGEEWSGLLHFYNPFNRDDEKKYRELESQIRQNIIEKRKNLDNKNELASADDEYVKPFYDFMNDKFIWKHGDYKIELIVEAFPKKASIQKVYRFIIYESDQEFLEKYKEDFKTGAGIYYLSSNQTGLNISLNEEK